MYIAVYHILPTYLDITYKRLDFISTYSSQAFHSLYQCKNDDDGTINKVTFKVAM